MKKFKCNYNTGLPLLTVATVAVASNSSALVVSSSNAGAV